MRRWSMRKNGFTKMMLAGMMCLSLTISMQGNLGFVHATEGADTATTATTETTNIDANGKLGKNSDVGVEVTKSITGTIGKKVDVAFKLKSNDVAKVKLKSVYPVIDTSFPFETSGDAYKVITAADEAMQQSMDVQFSMNARSDLQEGYQSVRFIGEYSKLASDGSWTDYYVIKTINIYFSVSGSTNTSNNTSTNSSTNSNKNSSSSGSTTKDTDDEDDDDDSSYTPSYNSSSDSSDTDDGEATAPKLLVSGYETKPEKIMAGETFTLTIHVQNTSKSVAVCNGKFLIGNEAGNFLPTSGSNAVFVDSIPAGKTGDLVIEMKTAPDLPQKNYTLVVKGDFDDGKGNNFTSSDNLSVPVYQDVKLGITDVSMSPEVIGIDTEGSLMFTVNNQGNAGVYNVMVAVEDEAVSCEDSYVGNIAAGSSAYATLNVVGVKDNSDVGTIKVVITYEDAEGAAGKLEQQVSCKVSEDYDPEFEGLGEDEEFDEEEGMPLWLKIVIAVFAVAVIVVVIILIVRRKKKKNAELLEDDEEDEDDSENEFEDEYGEDDIENEDF
ncbi:MAG: hypothetical protein PUC12_09005 [Clostridiales bacterium]|nr:hypothetical protein [Clostridiales bacterium]